MEISPRVITAKNLGLTSRARLQHVCESLHNPEGLVFDAGCGSGEYIVSLRLRGFEAVGVDNDASQLKSVRVAIKEIGLRAHLVAADLTQAPFRDSTFRNVICMEVINTIDNDEAALSELARILQEEGTCIISLPYCKYPVIYDPLNKLLERIGLPHRHVGIWSSTSIKRLYEPSDLSRRLRNQGLNPVKITFLGRWLVPVIENNLVLMLYYKVLRPKFGTRMTFAGKGIVSSVLAVLSGLLDFAIRLDRLPNLHGTHFVLQASKTRTRFTIL